ncbi:MAG TPA: zinc ribbon domain-containing protein [Candidatus Acidoferrum sp.]|nr:zinc ribbon domain-containing protein [Candidatus Acidoferrum sp.]
MATAPLTVDPSQADAKGVNAPPPGVIAPKDGSAAQDALGYGPNNEYLESGRKDPQGQVILEGKPKVVAAIRSIVQQFRMEGIVARRHEIRRIKKARLFWQGLQYSYGWDADNMEWQMPFGTSQGLKLNDGQDEEQLGPRYEFVTNIYGADGEAFIAVMAAEVPTIHWYPVNPNNEQDIAAAKAASEAEKLIAENNKIEDLLQRIGFFLWTDGKIGAYVRYVMDGQQFGFHDNPIVEAQPRKMGEDAFNCPNCGAQTPAGAMYSGTICPQCGTALGQEHFQEAPTIQVPVVTGTEKVPNGQEVITIVGGLELNTPVWANYDCEMPYKQWQLEVHQALLKASYPLAADKIMPGNLNDAEDVYARASRVSVAQGLPTTHPGDALVSLITFLRTWIRPWAFYAIEEKDVRAECLKLFPDGCYCAFAGDTYCESRNENQDEHWAVMHALPGDGQNRRACGSSEVEVQEQVNTLRNQRMEAADYGIPPIYADPQVLDFDALGNRVAEPGTHFPARARPGQPLEAGFFQPAPGQIAADSIAYEQELSGPTAQRLTGLYPAIYGGAMEGSKTLGEYAIAREQAMGRLGLVWSRIKVFWARVMQLAVNCFKKNRTEDVQIPILGEDGEFEAKVLKITDLQGNAQSRNEADEKFPQAKSQQRGVLQQFIGMAPEAPEIAAMLAEPANMRYIKNVVGLTDLVIPGEDSANKQLREISQLLKSPPIQIGVAPGPNGPQPQFTSTLPVDPDLDRHQPEMQEIVRWWNSPAGIQEKLKNPMGCANVRAHFMEHKQAMAAQQSAQNKPPSESMNFKDMPTSGKVQMAAQANIQLNPMELEAKDAQERADKAAELKAKLGSKQEKAA